MPLMRAGVMRGRERLEGTNPSTHMRGRSKMLVDQKETGAYDRDAGLMAS
jgi:hypothetical protein